MFSDDDAAVIDAISQAAVPHLQALLSEEQRAAAIGALQHQLSTPLATFRAVIEIMKEELERRGAAPTDVFGKDYLEELRSPAELMRGVLRNALFYGPKTGSVLLKATPTELMADAIVPAIRQVDMLLGQRGFSAQRIHCEGFDKIPPLWVDRIHFQQVVFNLLSNAIRYAADDAEEFRVTIDASQHDERFVLRFEDWGTGIQAGLEEAIFQEWVRGPSASDLFVAGQGLGLAITRRIVEAHGGGVCVTNLQQPTEVTVFLPASLAERPPGVNALTGE